MWCFRFLPPLAAAAVSFVVAGCNDGSGSSGGTAEAGAAPIITAFESEPNDLLADALPIPDGGAVRGELTGSDTDVWTFEAQAGEIISVELRAACHDQAAWLALCYTPFLQVLSPSRQLLAHNGSDSQLLDADHYQVPIEASGKHFALVMSDSSAGAGAYTLRVECVRVERIQDELEIPGYLGANDLPETAQPVEPGMILGYFDAKDFPDYYSLSIAEPSLVYLELNDARAGVSAIGGAPRDTELVIHDIDAQIQLSSTFGSFFLDPALSFEFTEPGDYTFRVTGTTFASASLDPYTIRVETRPVGDRTEDEGAEGNDTTELANSIAYEDIVRATLHDQDADVYAFEGEAGDMLRVWRYFGSNRQGSPDNQCISFELLGPDAVEISTSADDCSFGGENLNVARAILRESGTHYLRFSAPQPLDYTFRLTRVLAAPMESSPNDELGNPEPYGPGPTRSGRIDQGDPADIYSFAAVESEHINFAIYASAATYAHFRQLDVHGSKLVPRLRIYDLGGKLLSEAMAGAGTQCAAAQSFTNGVPTLELTFVAPAADTYLLEVASADGFSGPHHVYVLERR